MPKYGKNDTIIRDYGKEENIMENQFERTELLLGKEKMEILFSKKVAVFGVGGVGGYAVEALARTGIGQIDVIDNDVVSLSNINRQIIATHKTLGIPKVDAVKQRISDISPNTVVNTYKEFYMPENSHLFDFTKYDYIIDAIDTVTGKIELVLNAQRTNTPIISSMGTGNKLNPAMFEVSDIYETSVCPLARIMRYELKKRGVKSLKVVYSKECPVKVNGGSGEKKPIPGSIAFSPSVAGLIIAGEVIKDLAQI